MFLWRDDVDGKAAANQGRRRFHRDETSSYDGDASARDRVSEKAAAVLKRPQHHCMRQISAWYFQPFWSGASGEKQLVVGSHLSVREPQLLISGVDLLDACAALEVDAEISQGMTGDR